MRSSTWRSSTWFAWVLIPATLVAQQEGNEAKYRTKLAKKFATHVPWVQQLATAKAQAQANKKLIYGYFTRSYAP